MRKGNKQLRKETVRTRTVRTMEQSKKQAAAIYQMVRLVFGKVEHPYQRSLVETFILLLEVGNLSLIFECLRVFFTAASLHRSFDEARYWAAQAKILAIEIGDPGKVIDVWIWASEVQKGMGKYQQSLDCLQKALGYAYRYSHDSQFDIYEHIAKNLFYLGRIQEARDFHDRSAMCRRQPLQGLLRTASLKIPSQPLVNRAKFFGSQLLNAMWLPVTKEYHTHFQERQREDMTMLERLRYAREHIKQFYDSKGGIVLAQGISCESSDGHGILQLLPTPISGPGHAILLSHKTQNKNIELFITQESVIPKVVKMAKQLEIKFRKVMSKMISQ